MIEVYSFFPCLFLQKKTLCNFYFASLDIVFTLNASHWIGGDGGLSVAAALSVRDDVPSHPWG